MPPFANTFFALWKLWVAAPFLWITHIGLSWIQDLRESDKFSKDVITSILFHLLFWSGFYVWLYVWLYDCQRRSNMYDNQIICLHPWLMTIAQAAFGKFSRYYFPKIAMIGCFFTRSMCCQRMMSDDWCDIALSYLTPFKTTDVYAMRI